MRAQDWDFADDEVWSAGISETEDVTNLDEYIKEFDKNYRKAISDVKYRNSHKNNEDTYKGIDNVDWDKYTDVRCYVGNTMYQVLEADGHKVKYRVCVYSLADDIYYYDRDREAVLSRSPIGRWYFRVHKANKNRLYLDEFE